MTDRLFMRYLACHSEAPLNPAVQVLDSPAVAKQISQLGAAGQAMVAGENPDEPPNSAGSNVLATIQVRLLILSPIWSIQ